MGRLFLIVTMIAALGLFSCSGNGEWEGQPAENASESESRPAPGLVSDVTFKNLDGDIVRISDYGRKILMVNWMETWNADSKALIPIMNTCQRKYHVSTTVLGVLTDVKSVAQARSFAQANGVKFELLLPHGDPGLFGRPGKLPTTHIVTREDEIIKRFDGLHRGKQYEEFILAMYRRHM